MSETIPMIELNPRERRLWDRLRARVVAEEPGTRSGLRDLVLLVPDLVVLLLRLLRDDRVPIGAKAIGLVGIGYVLSPIDLLPEVVLGPIGLVDDLLVIGTALSWLVNRVHPDVVRSHWSGKGDALEAVHRVSIWSEDQLTGTVRRTLRRLFGS